MKNPNEFFDKYPKDPGIFDFDKLKARPLYEIIPYEAEVEFYKIATTLSLNSDLQKKYNLMDDLARRLDLTFLARGTNRSVYTVNYDSSIIIKIGYDKAGITDSGREFKNQQFIKPFCTKCFEVSPTGTVGLFERVTPIKHIEEFKSMAADIFDMLYKKILGKYIMADIGMDQYMNYGFRENFGPVILDYPYMYELDESKLKCRNVSIVTGEVCNGTIDYDDTFEHLVCDTCGKEYNARDLAKEIQHQKDRELYKGLLEESRMKIKSYGANASFDSEKGGKIEKPETITLLPPVNEQQPSEQKQDESVEYLSKDEVQKMLQEAYLSGMVDGKNKAEEQQSRRTFNPSKDSTSQPAPQPPKQDNPQPAKQPAQETPQPAKQQTPPQPAVETIVTIETDNPVSYRDPTPRGKGGNSNYKGWQTPRSPGKPLRIRFQDSKPKEENQHRDNHQGQQQQSQGQSKPAPQQQKTNTPPAQPKPNAPKPREPYKPANREPYKPANRQSTPPAQTQTRKDFVTGASSQQVKPKPQQAPKMTANEAFQYQPATPVKEPFVPQPSNSYDYVVTNKIMKHVLLFCIDNTERRDDVIYELTYITTLYHIELDSRFDVPMKNITDVVRKIVDLIEEKMENNGIKVEYEYEDDDRYHSDTDDMPGSRTFMGGGDLEPITDDQEEYLSYNDRLRNNGITFNESVIPSKANDQIAEEVGIIFKANSDEQVKEAAENLMSNNANPNDTSVTQELTERISHQLAQ